MEKNYLNNTYRLAVKIAFILAVLIICDQLTGRVLRHYFRQQKHGEGEQITYIMDSTRAEVIIFGSSRANHHYDPDLFEEKLHLSCYNAGRDGNYMLFSYALFKSVVRRYNPKILIFDTRPYELGNVEAEYDRLSLLLPFYKDRSYIRQIVNLRGPFEKYKNLSAIYPYNSLCLQIIRGNIGSKDPKETRLKGYVPLGISMNYRKLLPDTDSVIIDYNKIKAIEEIIATCKEKNIELIFVYSPIWKITRNNNPVLRDICREKGAHYIDLSNDTTFINHPQYFEDESHLNEKGARIFSGMIIEKILSFGPQQRY